MNEAREELTRMLAEDELRDAVLLVFANKQVRESRTQFAKPKEHQQPQYLLGLFSVFSYG